MSVQPIKIGIIGAGNNTRILHIPGLQAIEGVEIVSVCNRSRESSQQVADTFGIPTVYTDWRELVAAADTNAIVIGTWPYMHREMTCAVLEAGKHVMCEARMAMNAAEAHAMYKTSQAHPNLVAQIVPSPLTFRVDRTIQDLLAAGYLGDLYAVKVRGTNPSFADDGPLHWRHQKELSGLNILEHGHLVRSLHALGWSGNAGICPHTRLCGAAP